MSGDTTQTDTGAGSANGLPTFGGSGAFGLNTGQQVYPTGASDIKVNQLRYGLESSQNDYVMPIVRFKFYDPFGRDSFTAGAGGTASYPTVYIRMGGAFNTQLNNSYAPTSGIFGKPAVTTDGGFLPQLKASFDKLGETAIGAIQKQILEAIAGTGGFLASAGLNGKGQIEFLSRKMINNYNQLIYQGPNYRRFQLPFNMKSSSSAESKMVQDIIQTFRSASSPKAGNDVNIPIPEEAASIDRNKIDGNYPGGVDQIVGIINDPKAKEADRQAAQEVLEQITNYTVGNQKRGSYELAKGTDPLTFGYPDMCRFEILLVDARNKTILDVLFKSDFCVIESVNLDYGAGNKMSFYKDFHPTDITMSIALQEINFQTAGDAANRENYKIQ